MKKPSLRKEDLDLPDHLVDYRGNKCPIDALNPLVMLNGKLGDNYKRGDIVYPICKEGKRPGDHPVDDCITISTLNFGRADFVTASKRESITLVELIEKTGSRVGITLEGDDKETIIKKISKNRDQIRMMVDELIIQSVPENVREQATLSAITDSEETLCESGIICDSLDDVGKMLRAYEQGVSPKGNAAQDKLIEDVSKSSGGLGVALIKLASGNGSEFVEDMITEIKASNGDWHRSYDYDGIGCFFKTRVEVKPMDGKYILRIHAAYVGSEPEIELAEAMGAKMALISKGGTYLLSQIGDSDWVGVDLNTLFGNILSEDQIAQLAKCSAGEEEDDDDEIDAPQIDGVPVRLRVALGQENNYFSKVIRIGNRLFFQTKEKGSEGKYGSEHGEAGFSFSVWLENTGLIVDSESKEKLGKIRDILDKAIQ